jgi:hypothetical protein
MNDLAAMDAVLAAEAKALEKIENGDFSGMMEGLDMSDDALLGELAVLTGGNISDGGVQSSDIPAPAPAPAPTPAPAAVAVEKTKEMAPAQATVAPPEVHFEHLAAAQQQQKLPTTAAQRQPMQEPVKRRVSMRKKGRTKSIAQLRDVSGHLTLREQFENLKVNTVVFKREGQTREYNLALGQLKQLKQHIVSLENIGNMIEQLDANVTKGRQEMKRAYASGESKQAKLHAMQYMKYIKQEQKTSELLRATELAASAVSARWAQYTVREEACFDDLDMDDLEVIIVGITGLKEAHHYYVNYGIELVRDEPQTGKSKHSEHVASPAWNHRHMFALPSRTKSLLRKFGRLKLSVVVRRHRTIWKDVDIGMCEVKLAGLVEDNMIDGKFKIRTSDGQKGVLLEVRCRLRSPLQGRRIREIKLPMLLVDKVSLRPTLEPIAAFQEEDAVSRPQADMRVTARLPTSLSSTTTTSISASTPSITATAPAAQSGGQSSVRSETTSTVSRPAPQKNGLPVGLTPKDVASPLDPVLYYVTNDVLDAEVKRLDLKIAEFRLKANKQPLSEEEEHERQNALDRKQSIEIQLAILVQNVQSEKLSFPQYLELLQKMVTKDKLLLGHLRTQKEIDKEVLVAVQTRIQISSAELQGAMDNMAELEEA